jgi:hypothetical protein
VSDAAHASVTLEAHAFRTVLRTVLCLTCVRGVRCACCCCRLLGAVSDAAHASMVSKLLDQYEQKDNLAQQLEGITKMEVRLCVSREFCWCLCVCVSAVRC